MTGTELYQSVLRKLGAIPQAYLQDIDNYLSGLMRQMKKEKAKDIATIMSFAGSWSDMSESDFSDYLEETKNIRQGLFNREIDL